MTVAFESPDKHFLDLPAHGLAQFDVEPAQRLVEQKAVGVADDGAGDRHALFLAFGDLAGQPVQNLIEVQQPCHLERPAAVVRDRDKPS